MVPSSWVPVRSRMPTTLSSTFFSGTRIMSPTSRCSSSAASNPMTTSAALSSVNQPPFRKREKRLHGGKGGGLHAEIPGDAAAFTLVGVEIGLHEDRRDRLHFRFVRDRIDHDDCSM